MTDIVVIALVVVLGVVAVALLAGVIVAAWLMLHLIRRLTAANDVLTSKVMVFAEREVGDLRLDKYGPGRAEAVRVMQSAAVRDPEGHTVGSLIPNQYMDED